MSISTYLHLNLEVYLCKLSMQIGILALKLSVSKHALLWLLLRMLFENMR